MSVNHTGLAALPRSPAYSPRMANNKRDEFSAKTKQLLAERASLRCSNPDCRVLTKGPTLSDTGTQNAGCAAHIAAAAPGGPRYDASMTSDQRKSPSNGLWLCRNCGERVDDDPQRYPVALLNKWKADIEPETEMALGKPAPLAAIANARLEWVVDGETATSLIMIFSEPTLSVERALESRYEEYELESFSERPEHLALAKDHNDAVDEYCDIYSETRAQESMWLRRETDTVEFKLKLSSTGTSPLKGARLFLTFPPGFHVFNDETPITDPQIPSPPRRPNALRSRGLNRLGLGGVLESGFAMHHGMTTVAPSALKLDLFTPKLIVAGQYEKSWGLDVDGNSLTGFKLSLTHGLSFAFEDSAKVIPPQQAGPYQVDYTIHAENLQYPITGHLVVTVSS